MEYISIDEKDLVELYGTADNEMVYKMMGLMLEQVYPHASDFLKENKEKSMESKVEHLKNFTPSFNMVGLSVVSAKIELLDEKIKNKADHLLLEDAFSSLEESVAYCEKIIKEYRENIKNNI